MRNGFLTLALVLAAFASLAGAERKIPVTSAKVTASSSSEVGRALNGVFFETMDSASYAYIDLGGKYHLTRILYTGRFDNNIVETRLRGASLLTSEDGKTWDKLYTIPSDFKQLANVTNELDLSGSPVTTRYVGWQDVSYGSIAEVQWFTDTDLLLISTLSFSDPDSTGTMMACTITKDGEVPEGDISVVAYKAAQDYGPNLADWQAAGDAVETEDLGSYSAKVEKSIHLNAVIGSDKTYVRLLATCGSVSSFSPDVGVFEFDPNPTVYTEWRQLGKTATDCRLPHYTAWYNKDHTYRLFDNDETTDGFSIAVYATDFGRPIRIDKVRFISSGSPNVPVQGSNDGWNWTTITNRVATDALKVDLKLLSPQVYRYFRVYYAASPSVPKIYEVRFYTAENAPYVAVTDEIEGRHTGSGCYLSGTTFVGGTNEIENVNLRAWVADQDYGPNEAAWIAAGVTPVELCSCAAGGGYSVGPIAGEAGKVNYVRLQAVSSVEGCACGFGTRHAFTMDDEVRIPVTQDDTVLVMTNFGKTVAQAKGSWGYSLFGNGNLSVSECSPYGCKLPKRYRLTRIEYIPRYDASCNTRCASAVFYVSDSRTLPALNDVSWTKVAKGSSPTGWCDVWNQIYIDHVKAGYFMQKGDAYGNEQVRLWGVPISGLQVILR